MARQLRMAPMLASVAPAPPGTGWTYEEKYDGIRVLAFTTPSKVELRTRNDLDKAAQFPEVRDALQAFATRTRRPYVFDGEIVALHRGQPARFQQLQERMHVQNETEITRFMTSLPSAFMIFDVLVDGDDILVHKPWTDRYARLSHILRKSTPRDVLRLAPSFPNKGDLLWKRAKAKGWEGIMAKRLNAEYRPGVRTRDWLKIKIENRQELVVGGYTEPRKSRQFFGALLLGYYDAEGKFIYAGHTGGGFTQSGLADMYARLRPLEQKGSPFSPVPKTNERAHWVRPRIVVEIKFNEWTGDGRLRQPIFVGIRDDKNARDVHREPTSL